MHELVLLVDFLGVRFAREPGKPFLVHVDFERLIARDAHVNAQIELVTIDQQRIGDVLADHTGLVHVHVIDVIHKVDAFALTSVRRLDNPHILFAFVLLQFLIVVVEVSELIRQDVSVGNEIEGILAIPFLHAHNIEAESVFACDFVTHRELVDFLVFVEPLILVGLTGT